MHSVLDKYEYVLSVYFVLYAPTFVQYAEAIVWTFVTLGLNFKNNVKVNQSHYRPEVPSGFQEVKVPRLRDNGPGGKVVSLTHRPFLPPGNAPNTPPPSQP